MCFYLQNERVDIAQMSGSETVSALAGMIKRVIIKNHEASPWKAVVKFKELAGIAQMGKPVTANALPGRVKQVVIKNHEASPGMEVIKIKE